MEFTKMHGIGNDYIYFNCLENGIEDPEGLSQALSQYHFGVGADGIVLILPSKRADFRMRMFNADGSEGKMCGNASRCIGKYVYERGLTNKTELTLETLSGIKHLSLEVSQGKVKSVKIDMGIADFRADKIPVTTDKDEIVNDYLSFGETKTRGTCVSVGNPHFVIFTEDIDSLDLEKIGPVYENAKIFPERINTEFVEIIDNKTLKMRVWERGSGETLACGTGACAVASAAVKCGFCKKDAPIKIRLRGGDLEITCRSDGHIIMCGGAAFVFDGRMLDA